MNALNLLPPEKIKHLHYIYWFLFWRTAMEWFIVFAIVISLFLVAARLILENNANEITVITAKITENYQAINEQTKQINHGLKNINLILTEGDKNWSEIFYTISQKTPADLTLTSLSVRGGTILELTGLAKTRAAFDEFKASLNKLEFFAELNAPLANLAAKENIDFRFAAKLQP